MSAAPGFLLPRFDNSATPDLIKKSFMDPALCAAARDVLWAGNESSRLKRDDPESWVGPFEAEDENEPPMRFVNGRWGNRWCYGSCVRSKPLPQPSHRVV